MLIFLIDGFTKVTDKDAAVYTKDSPGGRYIGNSAGACVKGLLQLERAF
jgi:cystathionine beta-synthase